MLWVWVAIFCLLPTAVSCAPELLLQVPRLAAVPPQQRVVDLSHTLEADTIYWPGFPGFNITSLIRGLVQPADVWLEAKWLSTSEHGGTHVDAPAHFKEGGEHLHELPIDSFFGPGILVDVEMQAEANPDFQLGVNELLEWERQNGVIPPYSVVLVKFGWSTRWPDKTLYYNTPQPDKPSTFHFPGVDVKALEWLVKERKLKMLGVDVPSVDYGQNQEFEAHRFLCENSIPFVESLTNLDQLPPEGLTFFAVPLRVLGGSGVPVRAFAVVNGATQSTNNHSCWLLVTLLAMTELFV